MAVKSSIKETYHVIREQHIPLHLDQFCLRFNYRRQVNDIFNSLIKCGTQSPPIPKKLLTLTESQ